MNAQPATRSETATLVMNGDTIVSRATARPAHTVAVAAEASRIDGHLTRVVERELAQLRRFQWAVRATLALGVAASVCANVLHAQHNIIAQTIAAWPPLALMLSVELISRVPVYRRALAGLRILATVSIAGIAAYVSYFHMAAVVLRYGEQQPNPYLLPISVDGLIVVASVSLVELAGRVRAVRETLAGVQETGHPANDEAPPILSPAQQPVDLASGNGHVPAAPPVKTLAESPTPTPHLSSMGPPVATETVSPSPATASPEPAAIDREDNPDGGRDRDVDPEVAALLPAARVARDALQQEGRSLTRDSLAAQLRRDGHTIRTSRVSVLLNLLRNNEPAPVNGHR